MTKIYHITHFSNLASIVSSGGLSCDRTAQTMRCVQIGHQHIKERRLARRVPLPPGGCVGDYVPFYFAPRSPMLYAIHKGYVEGYTGGQSEIVHLVSTAEDVNAAALGWVFTDGHADMPPLTSFYNDYKDFAKIDWSLMSAKYWHDTDDHPDRSRRRQAEFLVHGSFPWGLVSKIGVHNRTTAGKVGGILANVVHKPEIVVEAGWYY